MDNSFIRDKYTLESQQQIAHAFATLAGLGLFELYSRELMAQLAAGDPDEQEAELLATIRDTRRQVSIYQTLHQIGLSFAKELINEHQ